MRILPIVLLTLIAVHSGCGKKQSKKAKDKGPCGKPFLKELNGKCYYVAHKKLNWFGAQNNCLRKGLNLADVSTQEDFEAVVHYVTVQVGMDDYWFGGNDLQLEGRFQYISSGKLVRYMGEHGMVEATHRSNMDDCLEIRIRPNRTVVLDVNCQEKKFFVCEQNQGKCAIPTADSSDAKGQHHSHEHLHHFHHDAGKKENDKLEEGKKAHSVESDSRPADNSNSTEIGVSKETEAEGTTAGGEGETTPEGGKDGATTAGEGGTTPAEGAAGESTAAPDAAATTAEGATEASAAPGAEVTTPAAAAPEAGAAPETPAPAA
ncbi:uncharacterized protein LOC119549178 [Drosophila subpulchrella]|uniref:uncharacterized protein LOC119549178 n=1 Tax=Drosophila subpulchrella TaxID=1486046 RepID=UPI0018A13A94|nr:uncharacterized protein LOC119549178 [Drosophila subpulchrella]